MIAALNPKRYRVEHIFDLSEAMLRAKIVLAHALVVHADEVQRESLEAVRTIADRLTPVLVSSDESLQGLAMELDGRFVAEPFEVHAFKRAVYRAVSKTQERRHSHAQGNSAPEARATQRIILLYGHRNNGSVMAAVLRNQLGAECEVTITAHEALMVLEEERVDCVVADADLLMATSDGARVAQELARRGIPVVPLPNRGDLDVSSAGQAAWDVAPRVRRSLMARSRMSDPAGRG